MPPTTPVKLTARSEQPRPRRPSTTARTRRGRALLDYQRQLAMSQLVVAEILYPGTVILPREGYFGKFNE